jgi:hypothetical protein
VSISGNLRTMPFADLLQWVSQSRKTGTLAIEGPPFNKKVYFRDGLAVAVASESPKEYLSYYLVGWGYVSEQELHELLQMQDRHGTMLGELLVIVGRLTREELLYVLQVKTEESIYELFLRDQGDFRFLENILPAKKFQPLALPLDMISLEGVRRRDEWIRVRELITDERWIPRVVRAVDVRQMGPTELGILREINGANSIEQISLACRLALFHVLQFVYHGVHHGLFQLQPPASDVEQMIPGFSQGAWRLALKDAEKALADGDLVAAHRKAIEAGEKFPDNRDAQDALRHLEMRITKALEERKLLDGTVLELAIPVSQLTTLSCSPQEGFLLSRINGVYTLGEILKMVPGPPLENRLMVEAFIRRNVVRHKGEPARRSPGARDARAG